MDKFSCFLVVPVFWANVYTFDINSSKLWNRRTIRYWHSDSSQKRVENPAEFGVGAMWFDPGMPKNLEWDNEKTPHLFILTPGGIWDVDSRASNCTNKKDRLHRCWGRMGEAPNISAGNLGNVCNAGQGCVTIKNWTGWLTEGQLITEVMHGRQQRKELRPTGSN